MRSLLLLVVSLLSLSGCIMTEDMVCENESSSFKDGLDCYKKLHYHPNAYRFDAERSNVHFNCARVLVGLVEENRISDDEAWMLLRRENAWTVQCYDKSFLNDVRVRQEEERRKRMEANTIWRD